MSHADTIGQHLSRWQRVLSGRQRWTREAWIDRLVAANKTWSPEELAAFWGQNREPSNYPIIHPVIESVCGLEAQTRRETLILSRVQQHRDTAEALTALLRYVDQQNKTTFVRSAAFRAAASWAGVGWTEVCWNDDPRGETVKKRAVDPMHIWLDVASREDDLSDAQDIFRARWLPRAWVDMRWDRGRVQPFGTAGYVPDIAYDPLSHSEDYNTFHGDEPPVGLFNQNWGGDPNYGPGHGMRAPLNGYGWATQDADNWWRINRYEDLCLVVERWYRADCYAHFVVWRDGRVVECTDDKDRNRKLAEFVISGEARLVRAISKKVRCAIFIASDNGGLLQDVASPYPHGQFPFVPTWGYRDEEGQPYGIVRLLRDPAREFNMTRTSLTKKSLMRQVYYEPDAFEDVDEAVREIAKYNGVVAVGQGAISGGKFKVEAFGDVGPGQVQLQQSLHEGALSMVQNLGPVTQEMLGQQTDAKSGVAIQERKEGSQLTLTALFDHRNWAQQTEQEQTLALVQESYTEEKEIRITGSSRGIEYLQINKRDPARGIVLNDVSQGRYDVVVDEQPMSPTQRASHLQAIAQLLQGAELPPEVRMKLVIALAEGQNMESSVLETMEQALEMLTQAQQQPPQAQPSPDKAMDVQAKMAMQDKQHAHEAAMKQADMAHGLQQGALTAEQQQAQADADREHQMQMAAIGHQQTLQQAEQAAALTPPPPSGGGFA